jgi:DNA-binding Lrp family transcriptional regulator
MLEMNRTVYDTGKNNLVKPLDVLNNLSDSARKIYHILTIEGPIRSITISKKYDMSVRTVRYNLSKLVDNKIVCRVPSIEDTRINYYRLI